MNTLNVFVVILVIGGNVGNIYSEPEPNCPTCIRNTNGMCMLMEAPCSQEINLFHDNTHWNNTDIMDCFKRDLGEVKICYMDCVNIYNKERCPSISHPVCGHSKKLKQCKKFANPCLFKQDACSDPNLKDWRVAHITACQFLAVGGPAGDCVKVE